MHHAYIYCLSTTVPSTIVLWEKSLFLTSYDSYCRLSTEAWGRIAFFSFVYYSSRIRGQTVPQKTVPGTHVEFSSPNTTHTDTHNTRHKMSRFSPYLPAALPSIALTTSSMHPNRVAAAPHEPDGGVRCPGLRALHLVPFLGAPKWRPSEYCETGGAPALEWPLLNCLMQQPNERWCRR